MSMAASVAKPFRTTVCRDAWYYLVVLAVVAGAAMYREINLLLVLAGMIGGPLCLSWFAVRSNLRRIQVLRRLPRGICAGDLLVVNLELKNTGRRGSWALLVEERVRRAGGESFRPRVYFPYVAGRDKAENAYRGRLTQRGEYEIGPLRVSTRFPFGLLKRTLTAGQKQSIVVYPRLGRLTEAWVARHHETFEGAQHRQQRFTRAEGQFYGVRYWRNGDSRRWIHWRSSARQGELVVQQFEQPRTRDVAVIVELWEPERPSRDDRDHVELAVSFASTIISDLCRKGNATLAAVSTSAPERIMDGPASTAIMHDCMHELAVARASHEDRLPRILDAMLDKIDGSNEVVIVSTREVDLEDSVRFASLRTDPSKAAALRRIRRINVSGPALSRYFQVE